MYKKSLYSAVILGALLSAACQHDPLVINSTWHKPGDSKPLPRSSPAGRENAESNSIQEEGAEQNTANRSAINSTNRAMNSTNKAVNRANKP